MSNPTEFKVLQKLIANTYTSKVEQEERLIHNLSELGLAFMLRTCGPLPISNSFIINELKPIAEAFAEANEENALYLYRYLCSRQEQVKGRLEYLTKHVDNNALFQHALDRFESAALVEVNELLIGWVKRLNDIGWS